MSAAPDPQRASRPEGEAARARLLQSGLRLFAQQGFAKTSTRELAEAAAVNVASISYYFGDKAGLYRAVFLEPLGKSDDELCRCDAPGLSLEQALARLFAGFLEPLKRGDAARLCMKLHYREMLEPTGMWERELSDSLEPMHHALLAVLCRHLGVEQPDDDLKRLALCIAGLGMHLHVGHDLIDKFAPRLHHGHGALDRWSERLVMYSLAMIAAEGQRRGLQAVEAVPA
jgi:TetR/AcrR family transcriptional regulator, regulator of cefoperazone and chloramphenicol sensitivity